MEEHKKENKTDKLKHLFEIYCQYGDKSNTTKLSSSKFKKLMTDSKISSLVSSKDLDLIFTKLTNSNNKSVMLSPQRILNTTNSITHSKTLEFEQFLQSIILISEKLNKCITKTDKKEKINLIIDSNLIPLYMDVSSKLSKKNMTEKQQEFQGNQEENSKSSMYIDSACFNLKLNIDVINIFNNLCPILQEIYSKYFRFETSLIGFNLSVMSSVNVNTCNKPSSSLMQDDKKNIESIYNQSKQAMLKVLKDFDIYPVLINKELSYDLFTKVLSSNLDNNNEFQSFYKKIMSVSLSKETHNKYAYGQVFTFNKFILYFILLTEYKLDIDLNFLSSFDKLCLIIERIENSKGFSDLQKLAFSLGKKLKYFILPEKTVYTLQDKIKKNFSKENSNSQSAYNYTNLKKDKDHLRKEIISNYQSFITDDIKVKYHTILFEIFTHFCSLYDPLIKNKLKFFQFEKMLKLAHLINVVNNKPKSKEKIRAKSKDNNSSNNENIGKFLNKFDIEQIFYKAYILKDLKDLVSNSHNKQSVSLTSLNLTFYQYLYSLELIAVVLYGTEEPIASFEFMIENNFKPLHKYVLEFENSETTILDYYLSERQNNDYFVSNCILNINRLLA
jgi:hypothetical protein